MAPPLIGLTSYAETARWAVWEGKAAVVGWVYVDAIHRAGGRTLMIPPAEHGVDTVLDVLDGLMLAGGVDLDPAFYDAVPHIETDSPQTERDQAELALVQGALERDMPVFGICRGMQIMNVACGGTLIQHLPEHLGSSAHREVVGVFSEHPVEIAAQSLLEEILGPSAPVKSHHHQAADRIGSGLAAVAWSDDGLVEAIEAPDRTFALGVQWHPEEGPDMAIFNAFIDAATAYRAARG